jgi:RNA polymerase sigma factor (sigma-70 family)
VARVRRNIRLTNDRVQRATAIFREYGSFIRTIIRTHTHDWSEQEDLCQEFYLALIRKPVPAEVQYIKSYLYRAVIHHITDSLRGRQAYRRRVKKYAEEVRISINNDPAGNVLVTDTEEMNARIAYFARHLQDREALAFVLRYRDNYSITEIAARMGVTARTVSRYLSASVRRLRDTLAAE